MAAVLLYSSQKVAYYAEFSISIVLLSESPANNVLSAAIGKKDNCCDAIATRLSQTEMRFRNTGNIHNQIEFIILL